MEKSQPSEITEELIIVNTRGSQPILDEDCLKPFEALLDKAEALAEVKAVPNLDLTFTEFEGLLDSVLRRRKKAAAHIPNIILLLARLVRVLEMHQTTLADLGFKVYDLVKRVTKLFVGFKRRLSRGMTNFDLMLSWLESVTSGQTDDFKSEFLELVKKSFQEEVRSIESARKNVQNVRSAFNLDEARAKIDEAKKAVKDTPTLAHYFKTLAVFITGDAIGGGATALVTIFQLVGPGVVPTLVCIAITVVLSTVITAACARGWFRQKEELLKQLQYFETSFGMCHELLNVMEEEMDDIFSSLQALDWQILESWTSKTASLLDHKLLENIKRKLGEVNLAYLQAYGQVSSYDQSVIACNGLLYSQLRHSLASSIKPPKCLRSLEWQDDKAVLACNKCAKTFNLFRRRHHCRICFKIFCNGCSSHRVKTKSLVRACADCAEPVVPKTTAQILEEIRSELGPEYLFSLGSDLEGTRL